MTTTRTKRSQKSNATPRASGCIVPVADKLRWTVAEASAICGIGRSYLYELLKVDGFPPRAHVNKGEDDEGGKLQFIASEVRAWADGRDWRALVALRHEVAHAS